MNNQKIGFLFLFVWCVVGSLTAQSNRQIRIDTAMQEIRELKEGKLLIVLPSYLRKLNALYEAANKSGVSPDRKQKYLSLYNKVLAERKNFEQDMQEAFDELYRFSSYSFIYDFQLRSTEPDKNYAEAPPFSNPSITGYTHRLRIGKTREAEQFGVQAYILTNERGEDLTDPFPYYYKANKMTWLASVVAFFKPSAYKRKSPQELVQEMQTSLQSFYEKVKAEQ